MEKQKSLHDRCDSCKSVKIKAREIDHLISVDISPQQFLQNCKNIHSSDRLISKQNLDKNLFSNENKEQNKVIVFFPLIED